MTNSTAIKIAVLGAGIISQSIHIPSLQRAGFQLIAVCDLSPARAKEVAERFGVLAFTNPKEVLALEQIDAVLIATPGSHAELTIQSLEAGKHVLAEKPLAINSNELDAIEKAQQRSGKVLQIGYMKMYDPLARRAAKEIAYLESVRLVQVTVAHPEDKPQIAHLRITPPVDDADQQEIARAKAYEMQQSASVFPDASEIFQSFYRGIIHGSLIHEISMLRGLGFELPKDWKAEIFPPLQQGVPSSILAIGATEQTRFVLSWNWLPEYPEYDEQLKVLASNGRVHYNLAKPYVLEQRSQLTVEKNVGTERQATTYTEINESGFLRQLLAFQASIQQAEPVLANLAGVRKDVEILEAIARAILAN